jgi:hypothetical protein
MLIFAFFLKRRSYSNEYRIIHVSVMFGSLCPTIAALLVGRLRALMRRMQRQNFLLRAAPMHWVVDVFMSPY